MANATYNKILVIDTASGSAITADLLLVRKLHWVGATTAGHTCVVQDKNGNPFWEAVATGANFDKETDFWPVNYEDHGRVIGLKVPTLASGKLYIYCD